MTRAAIKGMVVGGGILSGLCIIAITIIMTYEVVARYVFNAPTSWALEINSYLLVWSACLGAGYTLRHNGHVAVDVVIRMLPKSLQSVVVRSTQLAIAAFALVLIYYGFGQVLHAYRLGEISLTPLAVRLWVPSAAVPLGGALLMLQALEFVVHPPTETLSHSAVAD